MSGNHHQPQSRSGNRWAKTRLKHELGRLFRSMDFVARHPALKGRGREAERYATIYQQLGLAWEFLGLQCRHPDGWQETAEGKRACKVCGKIQGTDEPWLLLPRSEKKTIGRRAKPMSKRIFAHKGAARVVDDRIVFHEQDWRLRSRTGIGHGCSGSTTLPLRMSGRCGWWKME